MFIGKLNLNQYFNFFMMNTPILTKQQQRHSLSAKKGSVKGLRNVLAQPQDHYWYDNFNYKMFL